MAGCVAVLGYHQEPSHHEEPHQRHDAAAAHQWDVSSLANSGSKYLLQKQSYVFLNRSQHHYHMPWFDLPWLVLVKALSRGRAEHIKGSLSTLVFSKLHITWSYRLFLSYYWSRAPCYQKMQPRLREELLGEQIEMLRAAANSVFAQNRSLRGTWNDWCKESWWVHNWLCCPCFFWISCCFDITTLLSAVTLFQPGKVVTKNSGLAKWLNVHDKDSKDGRNVPLWAISQHLRQEKWRTVLKLNSFPRAISSQDKQNNRLDREMPNFAK